MTPFGHAWRHWRTLRRLSQLELASVAGTPPRHVSFRETGRAHPSAGMVRRLATALDLPPAEHNALLTAAGFAPVFPEHPLSHEALAGVQFVVQRLLAAYAPYPALVRNAWYDIVDLNAGARSLLRALGTGPSPHGHEADGAAASPGGPLNLVELLHTQLRPLIVNDLEVRTDMRQRLRRDLVERPGDARLTALLSQLHMPTRPPRRRGCPRCCSHASGSPAGVCKRSRPSCTSAAPVT
jgi:transcriptional regulator with XRE-family HTH domain